MKRLTDPAFKYDDSASTDIRRLFARIRRRQKEERERAEANVRAISPLAASRKGKERA